MPVDVLLLLLSLLLLTSEDTQVDPINLVVTLVLVSLGIFILNYQKAQKEPECAAASTETDASEQTTIEKE